MSVNAMSMDCPRALPFTDEEMERAGLLGEDVSENVVQVMKTMRENPELLDLSLWTLQCMNNLSHRQSLASLSTPTREPSPRFPALQIASDTAEVHPYNLSEWERSAYYHGISSNPPKLLYRSDLLVNPFIIPEGRFRHIPCKTVYGVYDTPLNTVWDKVAPEICELLKARKIRYSVVKAARFVTDGDLGPVVIWIATHPATTTAESAHNASPDILALLKANGVEDVVVEWYEGAVEKLSGPPLLPVTDDSDPTHHVRRFLTATLGMPIAVAELNMSDVNAQGTVSLFFHETKDECGAPSDKVFGVTNRHVLFRNNTIDYESKGAGRLVQLAGLRRFQDGINEIKDCASHCGYKADLLTREIVELEARLRSEDLEEAEDGEAQAAAQVQRKREKLSELIKDIGVLEAFYEDAKLRYDLDSRTIGHVHWAPRITVEDKYSKDMATFEVNARKFKAVFKGNIVDLGSKFSAHELAGMFYPHSHGRTTFKYPTNRQLRINGVVTRELLGVPDCYDNDGRPGLVVMKDGNTTDLTVGRYAGLEAYLCDRRGVESVELAIYNYDLRSGSFSAKGDSGSLIFDGEGRMVGIVHSGMPTGGSNHVTYATPAWWAIEQLKSKYPNADFNRTAF